jgi:hypothetical protein
MHRGGAGVDHQDVSKVGLEIDRQIQLIGVELQLVFHHRRGLTWLGYAKIQEPLKSRSP